MSCAADTILCMPLNTALTKAFKSIGKEEWIESTLDYLAHDHKGNIR